MRGVVVLAPMLLFACGPVGDLPADGHGASATGAPCTLAAECEGGLCITAIRAGGVATGWADGSCSRACPQGTCPEGESCAELSDGNWCVPACSDPGMRGSCRVGYVCNTEIGGCLPDCREGWPCGAAYACDAATGECKPASGRPAPVGAPCTEDAQCASGTCIAAIEDGKPTGFAGGACVAQCGPTGCPQGGTCVALPGGPLCLSGCETSANCRPGYVCPAPDHACIPDCNGGFDCGPNRRCEAATGNCVAAVGPGNGAIGAACKDAADCASEFCLAPMGGGGGMGGGGPGGTGTGGFCSALCGTGSCPAGTACVGQGLQRHCMPSCGAGGACPTGLVCDPLPKACVPDCRAGWPCPGMATCSPDGTCAPSRRPPPR
ncbi:MAG: hypothetical protein FJ087_12345 [Deltaproteobacteria bacterium]|nr:hypothetical protein [Deltaproteobacteria bacterium]